MSELVINTTAREAASAAAQAISNIPDARINTTINLSVIQPPPLEQIINASATAAPPAGVGGFTLALTVFILGSIFMLMAGYLLFIWLFGQPGRTAKEAASGASIIQHFNTPKSAIMKLAKVSGGGFQYKDIRDGTVSATPESVMNVDGRELAFTFAQLGVTIPPKILAGVSVLVHKGVNSLQELKDKYYATVIPVQEVEDENTHEVIQVPAGQPYQELTEDATLLEGYNFNDFKTLLKQSKEEKLIPLTIEAVPSFVERNINADFTEKKLTIEKLQYDDGYKDNSLAKIIGIAVAIALIIFAQTAIK